jgi:hypothetical protein
VISSLHLLMMVTRCPQAKVAAQKPIISMSCRLVKRCGMETGSLVMKLGWLYWATLASRKDLRFSIIFSVSSSLYQVVRQNHFYLILDTNYLILNTKPAPVSNPPADPQYPLRLRLNAAGYLLLRLFRVLLLGWSRGSCLRGGLSMIPRHLMIRPG